MRRPALPQDDILHQKRDDILDKKRKVGRCRDIDCVRAQLCPHSDAGTMKLGCIGGSRHLRRPFAEERSLHRHRREACIPTCFRLARRVAWPHSPRSSRSSRCDKAPALSNVVQERSWRLAGETLRIRESYRKESRKIWLRGVDLNHRSLGDEGKAAEDVQAVQISSKKILVHPTLLLPLIACLTFCSSRAWTKNCKRT